MFDDLAKPEVDAILIRRFPIEDMRRRQFDFEDAFQQYIGSPSQSAPGLPSDISPNSSRFRMTKGNKSLGIADSSVQLNLGFARNASGQTIFQALNNACIEMSKLDNLLKHQTKHYSAILVSIEHPYGTAAEIATIEYFYPKFLNVPANKKLAFDALVVTEQKDVIASMHCSQYKKVATPTDGTFVDPDFADATEEGIQFKFELNTKNLIENPRPGDFLRLFDTLKWASTDWMRSATGLSFGPTLGFEP